MTDTLLLDGFGPLPVRRPTSVADLGALVRDAAGSGQGVYPVGGGTKLDLGFPPTKPGFAVAMSGLNAIVDYPARDMTITAQTGITVAALQAALAAEGQFLPVDLPNAERSTLGGVLAANISGPRRFGRGTLRDYVIGISFVTDEGVEVKAGGRVVKNVAGYDLMKLQIGALGTLGVVTQVTLKVTPKPEDTAFLVFGVNAAAVGPTLERLHASNSRPMAVELLNATAVKALGASALPAGEPWVIVAGFEEKATTVKWQIETLRQELAAAPVRNVTEIRGADATALWSELTGLQERPDARLSLKANVLPSGVASFADELAGSYSEVAVHAHAGNGIVFGHIASSELTVEKAASILSNLNVRSAFANGNVTVRRCPTEWKKVLPIWGHNRGDRDLMRTVKATLDPKGVFNPGRLFGEV